MAKLMIPVKTYLSLWIMLIIVLISGYLIDITCTQTLLGANMSDAMTGNTFVYDNQFGIISMIGKVFQIIALILGIGIFIITFAALTGNDYENPQ